MTTIIRYEELPDGVEAQLWTEGDDTIIVVNKALPARRQRAAVRAAIRSSKTRRRSELLLPLPLLLAYERAKQWIRDHPAGAIAGAAVTVLAAIVVVGTLDRHSVAPMAQPPSSVPATAGPAVTPSGRPARPTPGSSPTGEPRTTRPRVPTTAPIGAPRSNRPTPPALSPSPTRRPQRPTEPPPSPRPSAPSPPPAPPTAPAPPPAPPPILTSSPEPVSEPTDRTASCDGINLRVKLDPLADLDACLLG